MIDNLDENFGRLMACLKKTGLDENTIILMTTDDGVQGEQEAIRISHEVAKSPINSKRPKGEKE